MILAGFKRHHDFFEGRVSSTFAESVDRAFDLAGSGFHGGQAVCHGQAQIVMAVRTDHGLVNIRHVVFEMTDNVEEMRWHRIPDRIRDVDCCRSRVDRLFDDFTKEIEFRAGRVFRGELDIVREFGGSLYHVDRALDDLLLVHLQFVFAMNSAGCKEHMQPRLPGFFKRFDRSIDVIDPAPGETADGRLRSEFAGDLPDGFEIAGRGDGKPRLNHVDTQFHQSPGNLHLLVGGHAAAWRLFAVAQSCVEDRNYVAGHRGFSLRTLGSLESEQHKRNKKTLRRKTSGLTDLIGMNSLQPKLPRGRGWSVEAGSGSTESNSQNCPVSEIEEK